MHFRRDGAPLAVWNPYDLPVRPVRWHAKHLPMMGVIRAQWRLSPKDTRGRKRPRMHRPNMCAWRWSSCPRLRRFLKKNFLLQDAEAGRMRISQLGNSGWRSSRASTARINLLLSVIPFWYTCWLSSTTGRMPFRVIVLAHSSIVSASTNLVPFQCNSRMPQHRSMGLYLL
jgi:hypothetical protein